MAAQVRPLMRWRSKNKDSKAVIMGVSAEVSSTLATLVRVSASMKKVNMPDQHRPLSHSAGWRSVCRTRGPSAAQEPVWRRHKTAKISASESAAKALRQKVTSKPGVT